MKGILTKKGLDLLNSLLVGESNIAFTKAKLSSMEFVEGLEELEEIKQEASFLNIEKLDDKVKLTTVTTNEEVKERYALKTIGIYAKTQTIDECLYAIIQVTDTIYVNKFDNNLSKNTFNFYVSTSDVDTVSISISDDTYTLLTTFNNKMIEIDDNFKKYLKIEDYKECNIDIESLATKEDIENLATKEDVSDLVTKEDLDKTILDNLVTKEDLEEFVPNIETDSLVTKEDLEDFKQQVNVDNLVTKDDLESFEFDIDLSTYATKTELNNYLLKSDFNVLSSKVTTLENNYETVLQLGVDAKQSVVEAINSKDSIIHKLDNNANWGLIAGTIREIGEGGITEDERFGNVPSWYIDRVHDLMVNGANATVLMADGRAVTVGTDIYIISGRTGTTTSSPYYGYTRKYDSINNTYTTIPNSSHTFGGAFVAYYDGFIYMSNGRSATSYTITASRKWNVETQISTDLTAIANGRSHGVCGFIGSIRYLTGGWGGTSTSTNNRVNQAHNVLTDTITTLASLPTSRGSFGGTVVGNNIYVISGIVGSATSDLVECYDTLTNTWTTKASIPTSREHPCCVTHDGKIYAIGGVSSHECYDTLTNTWTTKDSSKIVRRHPYVAVASDRIYTFCGFNVSNGALNTTECYVI